MDLTERALTDFISRTFEPLEAQRLVPPEQLADLASEAALARTLLVDSALSPSDKVLEIGAGTGVFATHLVTSPPTGYIYFPGGYTPAP